MILGVTGCPGSGKSDLAKVIASKGWKLIDADLVARVLVEQDRDILEELSMVFGADILGQDFKLNRRLLAQRAFADSESTHKLNNIVHPVLVGRISDLIREGRNTRSHTVIDCALIYEWGIERLFDLVVCVRADESLRKKRLMIRDSRTDEEIKRIFSAQLPEEIKVRKADIVLTNNGYIENLKVYGLMFAELPGLDKEGVFYKKYYLEK
jgi:dephospho-CoA kinase